MQAFGIVVFSIAAAVVYGIVHDQITARICIEYFTIGHPPVLRITDPTILGLWWGIVATWWVGFILGVPLAVAARSGSRPKRSAESLIVPLAKLLSVMAVCACAAGAVGWFLASRGVVLLVGRMATAVPAERHVPFITDLWAHSASYLVAFAGGVVLIASVWHSRKDMVDE